MCREFCVSLFFLILITPFSFANTFDEIKASCETSNVAYSNFTSDPVTITLQVIPDDDAICYQNIKWGKWTYDGDVYKVVGNEDFNRTTKSFIHTNINGQKHYIASFKIPSTGFLIIHPDDDERLKDYDPPIVNQGNYSYRISEHIVRDKEIKVAISEDEENDDFWGWLFGR